MKRACLCAVLLVLAVPWLVRGEHADIVLRLMRVQTGTGLAQEASAFSDQEPPPGGVKARPVFHARPGEPLVAQFFLTNTYPHGVHKGVVVRYYVVRAEKLEQKTVPKLDNALVSGEFHMNFKPKCKVGARLAFTIPDPGVYLLRVDTLNTNSDHEHFSTIDIKVE